VLGSVRRGAPARHARQALLDPEATCLDLELWDGKPISQYYAIEMDNLAVRGVGSAFRTFNRRASPPLYQMSGYFYAFNALSLYQSFSAYGRATNDSAFVAQVGGYLDTLADFYLPYVRDPASSTLADSS